MKKIYLLAFMLIPFITKASHEYAAQVSARYLANSNYEIKIKLWVDSMSISPATLMYSNLVSGTTTTQTASLSTNVNVGNGIKEITYLDTLNLNAQAIYRIAYSQCCRKASISNLTNPSMQNSYAYTQINNSLPAPIINSTPEFMNTPIFFEGVNDSLQHNPLAIDIDGDSLVFSYQNPMGASGANIPMSVVPYPSGALGWPFSIDAITGEITWIPNMTGEYAYAIKVDEYRNGLLIGTSVRDALVTICVGCKTAMSADFQFYNTNMWPTSGIYYQFQAYENVAFNYTFEGGLPAINSNSLSMDMIGEANYMASPPSLSAIQTGANIAGSYSWTPATGTVRTRPYLNVLVAKESNLLNQNRQKEKTILVKVNATPTQIEQIQLNNHLLVYPNPAQQDLKFQLNNITGEYVSLEIYSALGQKIYTKVFNQKAIEAFDINVSQWAVGNYIVKVNGKHVITKQFSVIK